MAKRIRWPTALLMVLCPALLMIACSGGSSEPPPASPPAAPSALSYGSPQTYTIGTAITALNPTVTGSVTSYAVVPALPAGLALNVSSGLISGTPTTQTPQATYAVSASNSSGSTNFVLTITVNPVDFNVGYQIVSYTSGLKAAVWYPTRDLPGAGSYPSGLASDFVLNAAVASSQTFPLILFSHGDAGCGTQSVVLTEQLARKGFIVAAPDHADALCSVDGVNPRGPDTTPWPSFTNSQQWNDTTYLGRRTDIVNLTNYLLATDPFRTRIDVQKLAVAGHSLGGYTALGLSGAWSSWRDTRFTAALLLSPYLLPFLDNSTLPNIAVPKMFQGGTADLGITPFIKGPVGQYTTGAYAAAIRPKYFLEVQGAGHFAWTNTVCTIPGTVSQCIQAAPNTAVMANYAVAFFRKHLQGIDQPLLRTQDAVFATYQFVE